MISTEKITLYYGEFQTLSAPLAMYDKIELRFGRYLVRVRHDEEGYQAAVFYANEDRPRLRSKHRQTGQHALMDVAIWKEGLRI